MLFFFNNLSTVVTKLPDCSDDCEAFDANAEPVDTPASVKYSVVLLVEGINSVVEANSPYGNKEFTIIADGSYTNLLKLLKYDSSNKEGTKQQKIQ